MIVFYFTDIKGSEETDETYKQNKVEIHQTCFKTSSIHLMKVAYQDKLESRNCKGRPAASVIEKKASG